MLLTSWGIRLKEPRLCGFIEASSRNVKGTTDTNGYFTAEDISSGGSGALVKKEGFHDGGGGCNFKFKDINKILNRFEPWNPAGGMS